MSFTLSNSFPVPILIIAYKRADTTKAVFESLRAIKPTVIYYSCNAPRTEEESPKTDEVRNLMQLIDWDCEVKTNFRTVHLSAKESITSGISWLFENEEKGIILEDDCLCTPNFFAMAQELLEKYKDDERVWQIAASNFVADEVNLANNESYYFSQFNHIWGWAGWRRAWLKNDLHLSKYSKQEFETALERIFPNGYQQQYWKLLYDYVKSGNLDTWDFQWMFSMWINGGLSINPKRNLIQNIGFGIEATNATSALSEFANMKVEEIELPLVHPREIKAFQEADTLTEVKLYEVKPNNLKKLISLKVATFLPPRYKKKIKKLLGR